MDDAMAGIRVWSRAHLGCEIESELSRALYRPAVKTAPACTLVTVYAAAAWRLSG